MSGNFIPLLILLGMVAARAQIPLDSLGGPVCGMIDPETKRQVAISPSFTRVNVVVTDAIAQAVVTQRFVNPFGAQSEAVFLFPLPEQGAVHGMKYEYRDSLYVARILEREKAQAQYDSIKQSGGQASLLLQERPNIFMQRIANLGAGETAYVEIRLSLPLKYADGELELAFPTRIGPRYSSGAGKRSADAPSPWNPPEDRSGPEFQFNALIQSGLELASIHSPTHPIAVETLDGIRILLEDRGVVEPGRTPASPFARGLVLKTQATYPNRDFVLRLRRAATATDFSLALAKDGDGEGYFMLNLYPDPSLFAGKRADMDLVLLIDISGSQLGWPLEREKEIALNMLSRLTPDDKVSVLAFSNSVSYASGSAAPVAADSRNLAAAEAFIRGLGAQGGTELLNAVNVSLAVPADRDKQRYYVFLTDGFITNETAILQAITGHPSAPVIFTFGAGNSLNRYFLEECAKAGNGFATEVLQTDAAGALVEAAWSRIESPQLEKIAIAFDGLETDEVLAPVSDRLYRGLAYRVSGKFQGSGERTVTLTASRQGVPVTLTKAIDFSRADALNWAVPKLWAREKIGRLALAQGTGTANKAAIIALSLEHDVLSGYTAFLASRAQPVTDGNSLSDGMVTGLAEAPGTLPWFGLSVRGSLLFLEWKAPVELEAILIHDLRGRLVYAYRPGGRGPAIGRWVWDGRDSRGRSMGPGRYIISVRTKSGMRNRVFLWKTAG